MSVERIASVALDLAFAALIVGYLVYFVRERRSARRGVLERSVEERYLEAVQVWASVYDLHMHSREQMRAGNQRYSDVFHRSYTQLGRIERIITHIEEEMGEAEAAE